MLYFNKIDQLNHNPQQEQDKFCLKGNVNM